MKKILISALIILLLITCSESIYIIKIQNDNKILKEKLSETIENPRDNIYQIDIEFEKCINKDYSTAGMNNCAYKAQEKWNKEIIKNSEHLKKLLNKDQQILYTESQKLWENYYKKEEEFILKTIFQVQGTIHTNYAAGALYDITKQRALDIKSYAFYIEH